MPVHTVEQGEHLSGIAEKYGFRKVSTIWDHPNNADLKKKRKNPHVLLPGDQVFVPDFQKKTESRSTGNVHKFQLQGENLKLKMVLLDVNGKPRANVDCQLAIESAKTAVTTGGYGTIEKVIPKSARKGVLTLPDLEIPLLIGHLDPVEEQSGQIARLNNLGYEAGDAAKPDAILFQSAVEEFQCDQQMTVTGKCDDSTQAKLKSVHGC